MTIDQVDIDKMCEETPGYFDKEVIESAFKKGASLSSRAEVSMRFQGKILPEILEIYGQSTLEYLGDKHVAMIRYIARFFPKYFTD